MIRVFFITLLSLLPLSLSAQALKVPVRAKSAILYNPQNQTMLFEKEARSPHYPASIMKIGTALYALEIGDLGQEFTASKNALRIVNAEEKHADFFKYPPYIIEHDGVTIGVEEGRKYTLEALLHGSLLSSGNDASNVLAEGLGGSIEAFTEKMNQFLSERGISQTCFQNPHGLHHPAQMTTAYDMARIAAMALENPTFRRIIVTPEYKVHDGLIWKNTSRFLKEGKYKYPYFIGGKTGYVGSAGYNLVVAAEKDGRQLIAVLLGCEKSEDRFEDAIHLFEAAFQEKMEERVFFSEGQRGFVYQDEKTACLEEAVTVSYYPSEETEWKAQLVWEVRPSSKAGKRVGRLVVMNGSDVEIASAPLIAEKGWKKDGMALWVWLLLLAVLFTGGVQARKIFKR